VDSGATAAKRRRRSLCLVVNPLAGIGGPLALKGSDGAAGVEALRRGARLVSPERAVRFLAALASLIRERRVEPPLLLTAEGLMGAEEARRAGFNPIVVHRPAGWPTRPEDTRATVEGCLASGAGLVVFVGGDGTARDVAAAAGDAPILGVPAGVKMYSSVFAVSPEAAAEIVADWLEGRLGLCEGEVMDIDEEAFRRGELRVRLYALARTPCHPLLVGASKQPSPGTAAEEENRRAVARYFVERYVRPCTLYILGPGSTVAAVAEEMGVEKTLLGVDVAHDGRLLARDVDEEALYRLVRSHRSRGGRVAIVVSPIGGQGFVLGRGNQQISPRVIREAGGRGSLFIVATRSKMQRLRRLLVDTGDPELDRELEGYVRVVVDYGEEVLAPLEAYTRPHTRRAG